MSKQYSKNNKQSNWFLDVVLFFLIVLLFLIGVFVWASFYEIPIGKYLVTTNLKNHTIVFTKREKTVVYLCPVSKPCSLDCSNKSLSSKEYYPSTLNTETFTSIQDYIPSMPLGLSYNELLPSYYSLAYYNAGSKNSVLVEILSDKNNGTSYNILLPTGEKNWVSSNELSAFSSNNPTLSKLSASDKNKLLKEMKISSPSDYLVWVDLARLEVNVFKGTPSSTSWILQEVFPCSSGALKTPTKRGLFSIQDRGLEFNDTYSYKNWLRYDENYLIHSIPYNRDTNLPKRITQPIQNRDSNGCITLSLENSKWLYDNIPSGTTILVN